LSNLGEIKIVTPNLAESGKHSYGVIGPDRTPVVVLPGDPIGNYLSAELFIRPMIIKMLTGEIKMRKSKKVKLSSPLNSQSGKVQYIRGLQSEDGQVEALADQDSLISLSKANCLIEINEKSEKLSAGDQVNILIVT
jgi:molybdopterin biosynthesis enzyme